MEEEAAGAGGSLRRSRGGPKGRRLENRPALVLASQCPVSRREPRREPLRSGEGSEALRRARAGGETPSPPATARERYEAGEEEEEEEKKKAAPFPPAGGSVSVPLLREHGGRGVPSAPLREAPAALPPLPRPARGRQRRRRRGSGGKASARLSGGDQPGSLLLH